MVEITEFKDAMAKMTSAIHVVTTDGVAGRHGFTASAVCSVTDSPPTLLVCMNSYSRSYDCFVQNKTLCVNLLAANQEQMSGVFSSQLSSEQRFMHGDWVTMTTGSPALTDALVNFDCEIEQIQLVGTHGIFICKIVSIQQSQTKAGLVYFNRSYHQVG